VSAQTTAEATTAEELRPEPAEPWRLFGVQVGAVRRLSPSYVRITFVGPDLDSFADPGADQRIKLVLPAPGRVGFEGVPMDRGWAGMYELPEETRPRIRTYTTRDVRPHLREVDVDLVLHGDLGPASRFAGSAAPGDVVALLGPDARFDGDHGGREFGPPAGAPVLLVADETAVPAVARILEQLPPDATGEAVLEVPHAADALDLVHPAGVRLTWLPREGAVAGSLLQAAVVDALARSWPQVIGARHAPDAELEPPEHELVWEVPQQPEGTDLYAWMAGEAGAITALRRYLVRDLGVPRGQVAFMGYWKQGRVLD
jgi:NADPH-dependent ferric siderophore reductase